MAFPPSYRFCPTDEELLLFYLRRKVMGTPPLPMHCPIMFRNLYGTEEPSDIFNEFPPTTTELYFFTQVKNKFVQGKRIERMVGKGAWRIQNTDKVYEDTQKKNRVIGYKKTLNFVDDVSQKTKKSSWIMHEYTLKNNGDVLTRLAVCRIKRGRSIPNASSSFASKKNSSTNSIITTSSNATSPNSSSSVVVIDLESAVEDDVAASNNIMPKKNMKPAMMPQTMSYGWAVPASAAAAVTTTRPPPSAATFISSTNNYGSQAVHEVDDDDIQCFDLRSNSWSVPSSPATTVNFASRANKYDSRSLQQTDVNDVHHQSSWRADKHRASCINFFNLPPELL